MNFEFSCPDTYWSYLQAAGLTLDPAQESTIQARLDDTNWDEPTTAIDFNNVAVVTLILAEQADDIESRSLYLEMALEALAENAEQHPLCAAHYALAQSMIGEIDTAVQVAFSKLLGTTHIAFTQENTGLGLVYVPLDKGFRTIARRECLQALLQAPDVAIQGLILLSDVLRRSQLVFYNTGGQRFLQLTSHLMPNAASLNLSLGLASLLSNLWEGLLYLQKARAIAPDYAPTLQALYLAYRLLNQEHLAKIWLNAAQDIHQHHPNSLDWKWSSLPLNHPFTYVPFDDEVLFAVEANLGSIVTIVMLAEGDWFEAEMEFWRNQLQPGMTVIDVGANVGVYTFSAAKRVGATGRVLAVEPFSGCVQCLEETRRVNEMAWVSVCAGAASDHNGTIRLSLHGSSELNEVIADDDVATSGAVEVANCYTLDHLIEQNQLTRVDWLKIDAEGHEMQVLKGSDRLLNDFAPNILYENIAAAQGSNTAVAEYLQNKGYQLFRYQPFIQQLIPISNIADLTGNLNIIAMPTQRQ